MRFRRKSVLFLLLVTVLAPIVLYTDTRFNSSPSRDEFIEEVSAFTLGGEIRPLNVLPQEPNTITKEPLGVVYSENSILSHSEASDGQRNESARKTRQLAEENEMGNVSTKGRDQETGRAVDDDPLRQVTEEGNNSVKSDHISDDSSSTAERIRDRKNLQNFGGNDSGERVFTDVRVRQLRDQLIRARVYLSLSATRSNPQFIRELRLRIKEVDKALGESTKDSDLPRTANDKMKAMEQTLVKGKQIQDDCAAFVKKLRAMLHSTEEQLRVHKKQALFLTHLTAKTLPKGLHCLPLRLSTEYFKLNSSQRHFPNQEKLENPELYHYAIFSDNILATAVVVNSTVFHAKDPSKHVFHIVTDRLNFAAMRMWFLTNQPPNATIEVQNVDDFTWLNSSYSPVLKQMGTPSMISYYFKARHADTDSNMKFRNPKYLSIMNHLRFYMPEIFPKLNKVLFLDDDIVVQKDLTALWSLNLKGKVIGVVETCGESFHRFDRYLNFSNPLISKSFDPRACGWAFGMNILDLSEWRRRNITEVYHSWQTLNNDRQLWKLGTLPPGLITFWNHTYALDRSWHVLGLGYNPNVRQKDIERAAVIHYNGNLKPWLEISIPKFRNYWSRFIEYDQVFLRECNLNSLSGS
ncbi:PREDICTED: probable galacturonosyltransferase 4 [Ipomoea nil]|uniref:probable galacturonosyltransferase 4 n=1 Tax=Ipomoea nil TaxID=35883 RepID=UPI000900888E|nr:PREDICTED: probable galacturonosyltransferase 4 [Ipomoea nil]